MKKTLRRLARTIPGLATLFDRIDRQGAHPAGHYYSPIPDRADVARLLAAPPPVPDRLPGIDLNTEAQGRLLEQYAAFYGELPFGERADGGCRFHYDNQWFRYADAIFLYSFLRQFRPRRIIEVGSGYSSAVILDVVERFFPEPPDITLIEPYPERLYSLLRPEDRQLVKVVASPIQDQPVETFAPLERNDLLLIDSSHVLKFGSDVQYLLFEVLPRLAPGVVVHVHDMFYPFEYPADWLSRGWYWNEAYALRAFLMHNDAWEILFFNNHACRVHEQFIARHMPLCLRDHGGSLYLRRR